MDWPQDDLWFDSLSLALFMPSTKSTSRVLSKTVAAVDEGPGLEWGS